MDFKGLCVGFLTFITMFVFVYFLLCKYELNRASILKLVIFSAFGHFVGGVLYYLYAINVGADSVMYFDGASTTYTGSGFFFAYFVLGYLRLYLVGDSFLGAFLFFAALSFVGSIFYLLTFKVLLDRLSSGYKYFLYDPKILFFPALLLLCWPSYFIWSAGLVKDSFAFLSIGIFLFFIAQKKITVLNVLLLAIGSLNGFLVRPYLFVIIIAAGFIYILLGSKLRFPAKVTIMIFMALLVMLLLPQLQEYGNFVMHSNPKHDSVSTYILRQQTYMSTGTSIPMPTQNPHLLFLFLPYLFLANLFLPLFFGARNFIGLMASAENVFLLYWVIFFLKNRVLWKIVQEKIRLTRFFVLFFLVGMACLSIMCTNLGLAMREKMMYVPALIISIMLIYSYRRILVLQRILSARKGD